MLPECVGLMFKYIGSVGATLKIGLMSLTNNLIRYLQLTLLPKSVVVYIRGAAPADQLPGTGRVLAFSIGTDPH